MRLRGDPHPDGDVLHHAVEEVHGLEVVHSDLVEVLHKDLLGVLQVDHSHLVDLVHESHHGNHQDVHNQVLEAVVLDHGIHLLDNLDHDRDPDQSVLLLVEIDYVIHLYFDYENDVLVIVDERQEIGSDSDFDYGLVVVVHVLEVNAIVPHQWEDHCWT